ncbi:arginine--tRNA ligase [Candidatus Saccharibacteria bacterium]|nr:arginine--tRNA ligase [Candidatus Saccharibacteria bacterium]
MNKVAQIIQAIILNQFNVEIDVNLTRPKPEFGDFATNISMQLSGKLGKNPREIAQVLVQELKAEELVEEATIAGPGFINLKVSATKLEQLLSQSFNENYGSSNDGEGKTAIVEYPSPNMAKPYSVGHLRPGNQGWAAKKLLEFAGWNVITDNHLGDYGTPFGIWVAGFLRFSNEEKLAERGIYELGDVYIKTKAAIKEEGENGPISKEAQDWLLKLENNDETAVFYADKFKKISMNHIHNIMGRLKISTDYEYGEAFFAPYGKEAVKELLDKEIAMQNPDGSVIVPLEEFGFDVPLLVQKSNGAPLYATTDLATILFREREFTPDKVVYSVGAEQQFYFSQLIAMAKKLGIKTELYHLWFGVIDQKNEDGTREKMSSRKGVVLMEELLNVAESKAREVVSGRDVGEEDVKKIALGAIKFSDFAADRRTNILFDWDNIFALTGFSGPYIQYSAIRVNNILRKEVDYEIQDFSSYDFETEKDVILQLLEFPNIIKLAARDLEPHKVAKYLYDLAREMNRYYEKTRVSDAPTADKSARLTLLKKVSQTFKNGLDILGIEVPEKM